MANNVMSPVWAIGLVAGAASALLWLSAQTGSQLAAMLIFFSPLPLYLMVLGWGLVSCLVAAAVGSLLVAIATGPANGAIYALVICLAPFFLGRLALLNRSLTEADGAERAEWYPSGMLLSWAAVIAAVGFMVVGLGFAISGSDLQAETLKAIGEELRPMLKDVVERQGVLETTGEIDQVVESFVRLVASVTPAATGAYWIFVTLANGAIAQSVLAATKRAIRPPFTYIDLVLPVWLNMLLAGALVISFFGGAIGFIGGSVAAILLTPYFVLGMTVVHAITRGWTTRPLLLGVFYASIFLLGWPVLIVVGVGLVEQWIDIRRIKSTV